MRIALLIGLISLLPSPLAHATVYAWKDDGGALYMSNDPEEVPEAAKASAKSFTAKTPARQPEGTAAPGPPPQPRAEAYSRGAFETGFERGLEVSERQTRMIGELAHSLLRALPAPAPVVTRDRPVFVVRYVGPTYSAYPVAFGGCSSFWSGFPGAFSFPCGFAASRFVPHSHFFPGGVGPRRGLFFPFGHATRDNGFLFGQGVLVD
jgi:hypothetical protein